MNTILLIMRNRARLEKMIRTNESAEKILKQSQKLDKYIMQNLLEREEYNQKIG